MGIWLLYIVSVVLAWMSGKYLAAQDIKKHRPLKGGLICIIITFIPIMNIVLMALAVADIIFYYPDCVQKWVLKFYAVKEEEPESQSEPETLDLSKSPNLKKLWSNDEVRPAKELNVPLPESEPESQPEKTVQHTGKAG